MQRDTPAFHLWTIDQMLGEEPVPSNETPDLSTAPLSWEERILLSEARAQAAEREQSNWREWLGLP